MSDGGRVTVFGASGGVGRLVVAELLARGDTVTAYVRSPDKVPDTWADRVRVVHAELSDRDALTAAVAGADAVVSALGPVVEQRDPPEPLVDGTRGIVTAMQHAGVPRFVGLGTPSVRDEQDRFTPVAAIPVLVVRTGLPLAYAAVTGMGAAVTSSSLDWTIVRFLRLVDGPPVGIRRVGPVGRSTRSSVTRADVARFVVEQLRSDEWVRRLPHLSN